MDKLKQVFVVVLIFLCFIEFSIGQDRKPKNIIFLIGDGMGLAQVSYYLYLKNDGQSSFMDFTHTGLIITNASDKNITDSAASATAYSCGQKTQNGFIGMLDSGEELENIFELATNKKMLTGLIASCAITHATPAAYYAHNESRRNQDAIAQDLLNAKLNIVIGGGRDFFDKRKDGLDLIGDLEDKGYQVVLDEQEFTETQFYKNTIVLTHPAHLPKMEEGRGDFLLNSFQKTLKYFEIESNPFFVVLESSQIDWGGHANDIDYILSEMRDFEKILQKAIDFAKKDKNTLVVVTGDHETGGLTLLATQQTDTKEGKVLQSPSFSTKSHSGVMVPVYAFGPGADSFSGIMDNTDIFKKMVQLVGLKD